MSTTPVNASTNLEAPQGVSALTPYSPVIQSLQSGDYHDTNSEFLAAIYYTLPEGAYPAVCSKSGDPTQGGWVAMRADQATGKLPENHNNYFNGSSFYQGAAGPFSVRKTQSAACHALLLDDLGTKASMDRLGNFQLSWQIETSPGNFQGGIILKEPITDTSFADGLNKAIIKAGLCDEGTTGPASRWMRLPVGINGKPQHRDESGQPFQCRLVIWNPDARYNPQEIVEGLQLDFAPTNHEVLDDLIDLAKEDSAAVLEPQVVDALATIKQANPAEYQRKRSELKLANSKVPLMDLDRAVKTRMTEIDSRQTHHGYATNLLERLTVDGNPPVGHEGSLFVVNDIDNIWVEYPVESLIRMVAEVHDGKDHCARGSDYRSVAQHTISLATNEDFFPSAPVGLATPDGFYQIAGNEVRVTPLTPAHRQRVMIAVAPKPQPTPLFDEFLHETFQSASPNDEHEQVALLQEISGAIMLGIMHRHQKAVLFYDRFGRAGKGTMERILRELVPAPFVTAVSPFVWDREYYIATLAGARLNVVGELPESDAIPAAAFKSVTGGDLLTGRHPMQRPIPFKNEAAHLFMSNHLISTKDHSEAFFARWLIVQFPNSRLVSGLPLDPGLAERIIASELPGIAHWALNGAFRLMQNGVFSSSQAHDRLMSQWRGTTNSVVEFINECCELGESYSYRRSKFYLDYTVWCKDSGRRGFSKSNVKEVVAKNINLGITLKEVDGYETFRGIRIKPSYIQELEAEAEEAANALHRR